MFCMHCGEQINEGSAFCSACGKPQQQAQASAPAAEMVAAQAAVVSNPQGATIATLDRPALLETIQIANSVITPYTSVMENYNTLANFDQYCLDVCSKTQGIKQLFPPKLPTLAEYGVDIDRINELSVKNGGARIENETATRMVQVAHYVVKKKEVQALADKEKASLDIAERNLNANIQYVNLIPPNYRYPLALNEIYSYLVNLRAESWKEAVNLYEEQLHRWQLEANSEEALVLQAQTAALAGRAASSAGTAALFSGLSFFFK